MKDHLSDTNVLSELARPLPNPGVIGWATQVSIISLSVVTAWTKFTLGSLDDPIPES